MRPVCCCPVRWINPQENLRTISYREDGHTASLFPDTRALAEEQAWAVSNWVEKLKTVRLTLTIPALNHSNQTIFLVTGSAKAPVIRQIVEGARLPEALIAPIDGRANG